MQNGLVKRDTPRTASFMLLAKFESRLRLALTKGVIDKLIQSVKMVSVFKQETQQTLMR